MKPRSEPIAREGVGHRGIGHWGVGRGVAGHGPVDRRATGAGAAGFGAIGLLCLVPLVLVERGSGVTGLGAGVDLLVPAVVLAAAAGGSPVFAVAAAAVRVLLSGGAFWPVGVGYLVAFAAARAALGSPARPGGAMWIGSTARPRSPLRAGSRRRAVSALRLAWIGLIAHGLVQAPAAALAIGRGASVGPLLVAVGLGAGLSAALTPWIDAAWRGAACAGGGLNAKRWRRTGSTMTTGPGPVTTGSGPVTTA